MDVVFLFFLLPRYGMIGYFVSFFITHLLNFILSLRRLLKITGLKIPIPEALNILLATAASAGLAFFLQSTAFQCCAFILLFLSLTWIRSEKHL